MIYKYIFIESIGVWHTDCFFLVMTTLISLQIAGDPSTSILAAKSTHPDGKFKPFGDDGLTFADIIDIINPLQHIPIISSIYRKFTGDTIDPASRIAGSSLYGGPIGAAVAIVNTIFEKVHGNDIGAQTLALFENKITSVNDSSREINVTPVAQQSMVTKSNGSTIDKAVVEIKCVPRPGGWIVNAAYGGVEHCYAQAQPKPKIKIAGIDIST